MSKFVLEYRYHNEIPDEGIRESDAQASAEGVTLSGIRKDKTDAKGTLENPERVPKVQGRSNRLNLSGKRTEQKTVSCAV